MENTTPNPTPEPAFLTIPQAAERMGRSEDFVRLLCREGQLPGAVQDYERGPWRIPVEAVETWLQIHNPRRTLWQRVLSAPLWQKALAVITVFGLMSGFLADSLGAVRGVQEILATETPTPTPTHPTATPTPTPPPTATPLAFATATDSETLILIASFYVSEGNRNTLPHREIRDEIRAEVQRIGEINIRVEVESTVLDSDQLDAAEALGKRYNASMVIWGDDTGVRVTVNFLNLREPDLDAATVTTRETEFSQLAAPRALTSFVTNDFPQQMPFFALFAIGQFGFLREEYMMALAQIEATMGALPTTTTPDGLADAYFRLGWLYQTQSPIDLNKSIAFYDKAIELKPNFAIAYSNRGNAHKNRGDLTSAIADCSRAIELNPSLELTYLVRGAAYRAQGDLSSAMADYAKAIELNPNLADAYHNRGNVHRDWGDLVAAIADYDKAIELNSNHASAYTNRGTARYMQGDLAAALADYDKAILLDPNDTSAFWGRGLTNRDLGNLGEALVDFQRYLELQPNAYNRVMFERWIADLEAELAKQN